MYLQLQLNQDSITYATINTHEDLHYYTKFPFGVQCSSAPAMFQKLTDVIVQGIPEVIYYIDDITSSLKFIVEYRAGRVDKIGMACIRT